MYYGLVQIGPIGIPLLSGNLVAIQEVRGLGRYWASTGGVELGKFLKKTRVGFGRTEISVRLDGIVFCALSFGHGPRDGGFDRVLKGVIFHGFWSVVLGGGRGGQK